jgi:hypothetical protein
MLKTCRCDPGLSKKLMNIKIVFQTARQLVIYEFLNAVVFLLQTPVPNYQVVVLSFVYDIQFPTMDPVKVEQTSLYSLMGHYFCSMSKFAKIQMSSPHTAELIMFAKVFTLIV